jgi:hypothetical protein
MKTSNLELVCVGNFKGKATDTQCQVTAITETIDHTKHSVMLYQTIIPVKSFTTVNKMHYCLFEIPDGTICFYKRRVQTVPSINEGRFFKMEDGVYTELATGNEPFEYIHCFLRDYIEKLHYKVGMVAVPTNYVQSLG